MANASAKRVAAQNEKALKYLKLGMLLCNGVTLVVRVMFRKQSGFSFILACLFPLLWTVFLYVFLSNAGTPKRDTQGTLISPGSDLNQTGLIEWAWDVLYITWFCQVGSSVLGEYIWWLYLIIPCYATYKVWTTIISPLFFSNNSIAGSNQESNEFKESRREGRSRKRQAKSLK